jgi:3-hydroxyacyl-CoA dehydrogenase
MPVPGFLAEAAGSSFYRVSDGELQARHFGGSWHAIERPEGVIRFTEKRQTMQPRKRCAVASWYDLDGIALVEFHSKANALDADSMQILDDALSHVEPDGMRGLIVHNDAQHFSCGVNLQAVREFFRRDDMDGLDRFLKDFHTPGRSYVTPIRLPGWSSRWSASYPAAAAVRKPCTAGSSYSSAATILPRPAGKLS